MGRLLACLFAMGRRNLRGLLVQQWAGCPEELFERMALMGLSVKLILSLILLSPGS
jgi:hypothetical protein